MAAKEPGFYSPSPEVAGSGAVTFVLLAFVATWVMFRHRAWVLGVFLFGVYLEAASLAARAYWAVCSTAVNAFCFAFFGAILAPSFLAAGCYMVFGRIVWLIVPAERCSVRHLWAPPRWITLLFVAFDSLSFAVQFFGVCVLSTQYQSTDSHTRAHATLGAHVLTFGLVLQFACFVLFAVIAIRLLWIAPGSSKAKNKHSASHYAPAVRRLHWAIIASSSIVALRAIYRVLEFSAERAAEGPAAYIRSHEWTYWVFDALPAFIVSVLLTVFHVGHALPVELRGFCRGRPTITHFPWQDMSRNPTHESFRGRQ